MPSAVPGCRVGLTGAAAMPPRFLAAACRPMALIGMMEVPRTAPASTNSAATTGYGVVAVSMDMPSGLSPIIV